MTEASTDALPPPVALSEDQQHAVDLVLAGRSIFFTGAAGTGKSMVLKSIITALRTSGMGHKVAITASTGIASVNIGGITLHSFAGVGLGADSVDVLQRQVAKNKTSAERWISHSVLIIDEISMLDADLFDKLEAIARHVRQNSQPFGGMQLVLCGDFFQLPPVGKTKFCFEAATWNACIDVTVVLKSVFRQRDPAFIRLLSEARIGQLSAASVAQLQLRLHASLPKADGIEATILFPYKQDVQSFNEERLQKLPGAGELFVAEDKHKGGANSVHAEALEKHCGASKALLLKEGAQVIVLKNMTIKASVAYTLGGAKTTARSFAKNSCI